VTRTKKRTVSQKARPILLPALGALIVLSTFVVKEGFRDHYKDLAATVDTARLMYEQDNQLGDIAQSIEGIRRVVEPQPALWQESYKAFYQAWISYQGQIQRLVALSEKIDVPSSAVATLTSLQKQNAEFQKAVDNYGHAAQTNPNEDARPLSRQSGSIFSRRRDLEGELLELATKQAKRSRERSELFAICSYFLYVAGWLLAFLGKALNVPGAELPSTGA
jgi:hypothetical protein